MKTLHRLYHLVRADFLERTRRNSFIIVTGLTAYLSFAFVPPVGSDFVSVALDRWRGVYNSSWLGFMFGIFAALILSLFAFYLVKDTIERDRRTGVGQIIAATPVSKLLYILGKWLSNLVLLSAILGILTVMAVVMQLVRAEENRVDLPALIAPIWLMGFPVMAVVSALAVLFESIPFLSGGFGNVVFFFAWIFALIFLFASMTAEGARVIQPVNDVYGITRPIAAIQTQVLAIDPGYSGDISIGRTAAEIQMQRFTWTGLAGDTAWLLERLLWVMAAIVLACAAALPFDRFDPSHARKPPASPPDETETHRAKFRLSRIPPILGDRLRSLSPFHWLAARTVFGSLLLAELRLLLHGQRWWWYLGACLLWLVGLLNSPLTGLHNLLPLIWIWPVLIWSPIGAREKLYQTGELIFSAPHHLHRQLPAVWLSGVIVTAATGSSVALKLAASGHWDHLFGWAAGALFIPSLALALGVISNGPRLFEIIYLLWWYMAFNGGTLVDFMSRTEASLEAGMPWVYLALSIGFGGSAVVFRRRQLLT